MMKYKELESIILTLQKLINTNLVIAKINEIIQ